MEKRFKQPGYIEYFIAFMFAASIAVIPAAAGPGGQASASVTVAVSLNPVIAITYPVNGQTLNARQTLVEGTYGGMDLANGYIRVNGVPAVILENRFFANNVNLGEGLFTITARANDGAGNEPAASADVNAVYPEKYVEISGSADSGTAPLEVMLTITPSFGSTPQLTVSGPVQAEIPYSDPVTNRFEVRLTAEGEYTCTAEATDDQGNVISGSYKIAATKARNIMDTLYAKWDAMKQELLNGNVDGAVEYFMAGGPREKYRAMFRQIAGNQPGGIAAFAESLPDPLFVNSDGRTARFILTREENGSTFGYDLQFVKASDGSWKIYGF